MAKGKTCIFSFFFIFHVVLLSLLSLKSSEFLIIFFKQLSFWLGYDFSVIFASKGTATEMKHF